jgi:hypothetical protein
MQKFNSNPCFFLVSLEMYFFEILIGKLYQVIGDSTPKFSELAPKYESSAHHSLTPQCMYRNKLLKKQGILFYFMLNINIHKNVIS